MKQHREIKFRAWHTPTKRWITDFKIDPIGNLLIGQGVGAEWKYIAGVDYILMQFTGRQGRNKKNLYEGDIVKFNNYTEHGNKGKHIGVIYWDSSESCFAIYSDGNEVGLGTKKGLWLSWATNLELLGNVLENPGLLNEEEE